MNCHRARQLISPYLDQQLTGRDMLALQEHFSQCASCEAERHSIRQVKMLLRALHEPRPRTDLPEAIALRLSEAEQPLWHLISLSAARPQRGRRLVTALALSCLTVLSFAASVLAPPSREGTFTSSGFLLPTGLTSLRPLPASDPGLPSFAAAPQTDILILTENGTHSQRLFNGPYNAVQPDLRLSLIPYETSSGSFQGAATFTGCRPH